MNAIRKRVTKAQGKPGYRAKVRVKGHARVQGAGLFAQQFIANGGVIAYYPITVVTDPGPHTRDSLRDYFIDVQHANGKASRYLTGRPDLPAIAAAPAAPHRIPYTGVFANEPGPKVPQNAQLVSGPRRKGHKLAAGVKLTYRLVATRDIDANEEIFPCYGEFFNRGTPPYQTSCCCGCA